MHLNSKGGNTYRNIRYLKVLVHDGLAPSSTTMEKDRCRGVARDLLSSIAQKAGWTLEYVYAG